MHTIYKKSHNFSRAIWNKEALVNFSKTPHCTRPTGPYNLLDFEKFTRAYLFQNCSRNRVITYTNSQDRKKKIKQTRANPSETRSFPSKKLRHNAFDYAFTSGHYSINFFNTTLFCSGRKRAATDQDRLQVEFTSPENKVIGMTNICVAEVCQERYR